MRRRWRVQRQRAAGSVARRCLRGRPLHRDCATASGGQWFVCRPAGPTSQFTLATDGARIAPASTSAQRTNFGVTYRDPRELDMRRRARSTSAVATEPGVNGAAVGDAYAGGGRGSATVR